MRRVQNRNIPCHRTVVIGELIQMFGGQEKTARVLGVTQPCVSNWKRGVRMPNRSQCDDIVRVTGGLISMKELTEGWGWCGQGIDVSDWQLR